MILTNRKAVVYHKLGLDPNEHVFYNCGGDYYINRVGVVIKILENSTIVMSPYNNHGYSFVQLRINGKRKHFLVHRLVATAFIHNYYNKPCVNHIDGNKLNNATDNLEWCTPKENTAHAFNTGLRYMPESFGHKKRPVIQYTKGGEKVKEFVSVSGASRDTGVDFSRISKCCRNKAKSAGGFVWGFL